MLVWSKKHKDHCRFTIGGLKKNEWTRVEFRAIEARVGWARTGPSLEGDVLDNLKLVFAGQPGDRVLLDDVEVCR